MIPYKNPGDPLTAVEWNSIFEYADTLLTTALGGVSAVLMGMDTQWDRAFFFGFDPAHLPTGLHPLAVSFLPGWASRMAGDGGNATVYLRQYDHSALVAQVAALTVAPTIQLVHGNTTGGGWGTGAGIVSGGSGYGVPSPGNPTFDILTVQGGTLYPGGAPTKMVVYGVAAGGVINSFGIASLSNDGSVRGQYTVPPPNPASVVGGRGTGATFNLSYFQPVSTKYGCVLLNNPVWSIWNAAIYPSGGGSAGSAALDASLQVMKYTVAGTAYNVGLGGWYQDGLGQSVFALGDLTTVEHAQPLKPIDVFVVGGVIWDTLNWDKYSVVRVHNCGLSVATVQFGTVSVNLQPGCSKCFRLVPAATAGDPPVWIACGKYFHWMAPGDGRFIRLREIGNPYGSGISPLTGLPAGATSGGTASIFMPAIVMNVLSTVLGATSFNPASGQVVYSFSNAGRFLDPKAFWDLSGIYNNPDYVPTAAENKPPAGGYLPVLPPPWSPGGDPPTQDPSLGDLLVPRGKVLVANRGLAVVHAVLTETVGQSTAVPIPTYVFVDGVNVVNNVSNVAVFNVTTGQAVANMTTPGDPTTVNWVTNGAMTSIGIICRGTPPTPSISNGDVLQITFDYIPVDDHITFDFTGFATLAAQLARVGVATRLLTENQSVYESGTGGPPTLNNLEIYTPTGWHMIDLSGSLTSFLNSGYTTIDPGSGLPTGGMSGVGVPALVLGASQSSSPPSRKLPVFYCNCVTVRPTSTPTAYTYNSYSMAGSPSVPTLGAVVAAGTMTRAGNNVAGFNTPSVKRVFLPTALLSELETFYSQNGGVNFSILSTVFGPCLLWEEDLTLDATFTGLFDYSVLGALTKMVYITKVVYDPVAKLLRVSRAVFLKDAGGWSGSTFGLWPPFTPQATPSDTLFWHFPRTDRRFRHQRYFLHDAAEPWMPQWNLGGGATNWYNQKYAPVHVGQVRDELSGNESEFTAVQSFYETTPISVDTVLPVQSYRKTGISRLGPVFFNADIWSPFAAWYNKSGNITYPNAHGSIATGGVPNSTINCGSGWYGGQSANAMANATIADLIPNVLSCEVEHYNLIASTVNAMPKATIVVGQQISTATSIGPISFSLNFAAANIIIVTGGAGYTVGQGLSNNLMVASVDSHGAITGVAQNGAVVIGIYNVYQTPVRPFAFGTGGATYDTSAGDGSKLSFIPARWTVGVPLPPVLSGIPNPSDYLTRMSDGYSPRQAFFSWNGATAGGADPLGDYILGLCAVQTTVPGNGTDTLGDLLPLYQYVQNADGTVTNNTVASYAFGCDANYHTKVGTYRWIKIDDARTIYNQLSITFALKELVVPYSWRVTNVAGATTPTTTTTNLTNQSLIQIGYSAPYGSVPNPPSTPAAPANNGGGALGPVNQIQADWFNDPDGQWVRAYRNENICAATSPLADPIRFWLGALSSDLTKTSKYNYAITSVSRANNTSPWIAFGSYTQTVLEEKTTFAPPAPYTPAGQVTAYTWFQGYYQVTVNYPQKLSYDLVAVLGRYENVPSQIAAVIGQAIAYYNEPWVLANLPAFQALGTAVVPIIVDNTPEAAASQIIQINTPQESAATAGTTIGYETVITTSLLHARLVVVPVDG